MDSFPEEHSISLAAGPVHTSLPMDGLRSLGDDYSRQFISFLGLCELLDGDTMQMGRPEPRIDLSHLSDEEREEWSMAMLSIIKMLSEAIDQPIGNADGESVDIDILQDYKVNRESESDYVSISANLQLSNEVAATLRVFMGREMHRMLAPSKTHMLGNALIPTVVSAFEVLIGSIAREILQVNKAALSSSGHEFSLEELMQYDSIQEAREELINRRIEALLMSSVEAWSKWLNKVVQFELSSLVEDWPQVREVFARRNVIVHDAGRANKRYVEALRGVDKAAAASVLDNERLTVDYEYLHTAVQRLLSLGLNLLHAVWKKLYPRSAREVSEWLITCQNMLVYDQMWISVREISARIREGEVSRVAFFESKVNGWLAMKNLNGIESVREEVERWDTSGLTDSFRIDKKLLLDDDSAVEDIRETHDHASFARYELIRHPKFAGLRDRGLMSSLIGSEADEHHASNAHQEGDDEKGIGG